MKKHVAVILAVLLLLSLSACGGISESDAPVNNGADSSRQVETATENDSTEAVPETSDRSSLYS